MSTFCPKCGKENTSLFSDSVLKNHGFYCEDCKKDFGVDDGKTIAEHEKLLNDFYYQRTKKDGITYRIEIHQIGDKVTITPSTVKDKILTPYESQDITSLWDSIKNLIFEKIFILDWVTPLTGFITGKGDESYKVILKYSLSVYPDATYEGTNKFPPYLVVLDQLFDNFFITE